MKKKYSYLQLLLVGIWHIYLSIFEGVHMLRSTLTPHVQEKEHADSKTQTKRQ